MLPPFFTSFSVIGLPNSSTTWLYESPWCNPRNCERSILPAGDDVVGMFPADARFKGSGVGTVTAAVSGVREIVAVEVAGSGSAAGCEMTGFTVGGTVIGDCDTAPVDFVGST